MIFLNDLKFIQPEIFISISILILLFIGTISTHKEIVSSKNISVESVLLCILVVFMTSLLLIFQPSVGFFIFSMQFFSNSFVIFLKISLIGIFGLLMLLNCSYFKFELVRAFEIPILMLIALFGMFIILSTNDLILLYLAMELQSLALYVLAASKQYSNFSTEAGLKYFILGSLASAMLLFGISLIYGHTGTTNLTDLSIFLLGEVNSFSAGILVGFVFLLSGLFFKMPAAPFHNWVPDVYEGSPTMVTAFFAVLPKLAIFGFFIQLLYFVIPFLILYWSPLMYFSGLLSLVFGTFGALYQSSIKRFLAYGTISHIGFMLFSLSTGTVEGVQGAIVYLFVYLIMSLGFFSLLVGVRRAYGYKMRELYDLFFLQRSYPAVSLVLTINLFSMAGVPPLAGFFSKFYILIALIRAEMYFFSVIVVIISAISCAYYIRFVRNMFFSERKRWENVLVMPYEISLLLSINVLFNVSFFFFLNEIFVYLFSQVSLNFV